MGLTRTLMVAGAGAALAYFFDPVSGRERRQQLRRYWQERLQGGSSGIEKEEKPTIVVTESGQEAKA
ncbi:MAG TPA: YtxH domain-containing protein [Candidatus Dormibacteraeota bacterium]|nr:YtxH domain-containing protein [Candidatus Dormibacteraeota bacterium]